MIFCMSDLLYKIIKPTGTIKHEIVTLKVLHMRIKISKLVYDILHDRFLL